MTIMKDAIDVLNSRRSLYTNAETYYNGSEKEVFAHARWNKLFANDKTNYVLNYSKTVVDTVLDRLELAAVLGTDEASNAAINKIWEQNELTLDAGEIHRRALVFGECYAIVWPDDEGEVQITYNSPLTTMLFYQEENPRKKDFAIKLWQVTDVFGKKRTRMNVFYADRVEKYSAHGELDLSTNANFSLIETVENPYGEIPVFHFRTHRPYGTPEHVSAIGPQDAINKLVANHMNTVDYQGAPQRWALSRGGASAEVNDFDDDDTARENIEGLKNGPGELWYLAGVDAVGTFDVADPNNFTDPIMSYVKSMASLTQTPLHYFQNNGQFASGEALRTAEAPLVKKIRTRQLSFGSTWRDIFRFALKIEGIDTDVQVKWQPIESIDSLDAWTVAQLKKVVGLPLEQILAEQGYDKEVIADILKAAVKLTEEQPVSGGGIDSGNGLNAHNLALQQQAEENN